MYKVFIENKPLIFDSDTSNFDLSVLYTDDFEEVKKMIREVNLIPDDGMVVVSNDPDQLFYSTFKSYRKIEAAGGLVFRDSHILLIHRLGMWDFPKGKIDQDERPQEGAIREIQEECGIHGHTVVSQLSDTWHTYKFKGNDVIKRTYWYTMNYNGIERLIPQTEEDITEARWVGIDEVASFKKAMYPSLHVLLEEGISQFKKWNGL
jgi:8-oxo-dGTP pyrophosphatase MutT (NUDIX family)